MDERILQRGDTGEAVRALQEALGRLLYDCGACEGVFDGPTEWALRWFQHRNGLESHGQLDGATQEKLRAHDAAPGVDVPDWAAMTPPQYYTQSDPLWGDYPYDAANTPVIERMATSACGPTAMAMAVSTLLRRAILPPVAADWANEHGHRDPDAIAGTFPSFFGAYAAHFGLGHEVLEGCPEEVLERGRQALERGGLLIAHVTVDYPYTAEPHYLVIYRIDEAGRVYVTDPNPGASAAPQRTMREWAAGQWAFRFFEITPR